MSKVFEAIVAYDSSKGIAKNGKIPWHIKEDMHFFKWKTNRNIVVMGSKTFESIGKPLDNRLNIVLTTIPEVYNTIYKYDNLIFTSNTELEQFNINDSYPFLNKEPIWFIIGGDIIYNMYIPLCRKIWVTKIKNDYQCDKFFTYNLENNDFINVIYKDTDTYTIYEFKDSSSCVHS
jgi:dihydrofolate reductase